MAEKKDVQEVKTTALDRREGARADIEATRGEIFTAPDVDIYETDTDLVLVADVPGVSQEGVDLRLDNGVLEITAHRRETSNLPEPTYAEFRPASYYRAFSLTDEIDTAKIDAKLKDGVLTVTLPKSERAKPRKIAVRSA